MNSNQRSQGNNQTDNGANEKSVSSSRGGTVEKDNLNQSQQSGTLHGDSQPQRGQQQGNLKPGSQPQTGSRQSGTQRSEQGTSQQGSQIGQDSTDRTGSQTGSQQQDMPKERVSNDAAGGLPRSPSAKQLHGDMPMDEDTGLSDRGLADRGNRQSGTEYDNGTKQEKQSNVGRRSDMTPD